MYARIFAANIWLGIFTASALADIVQQKIQSNLLETNKNSNDILQAESTTYRQDKMLNYFNYYNPHHLIPQPYFMPPATQNYYPTSSYQIPPFNGNDLEHQEEVLSRTNNHRRPHPGYENNSPIYYVRYVPGMGYMSPSPQLSALKSYSSPGLGPLQVNPFLNIPINFLSNGRPSNIYQFGSDLRQQTPTAGLAPLQQFQPPYYHQPDTNFGDGPFLRPFYSPKAFASDSKITSLKGAYAFNGRPEDLYLLPNRYYGYY